MATPFVAASAARRWGYRPLETNAQIGEDVDDSGWEVNADGTCWPESMAGVHQVNVAALLDRGALGATAFEASTGLPLVGGQVQAYQTAGGVTSLRGTGVISPTTCSPFPCEEDPTRVYMQFSRSTDVINLPAGGGYAVKLYKAGYTATPQLAFQHNDGLTWDNTIYAGGWTGV